MTDLYNLGIIGFGGMGHHHYEMLSNYGRANVKGVFDANPARNKFAEGLAGNSGAGLTAYPSADAMFADSEIDIVLVAATNEVHKELSVRAMAAGKHVICEKPVTISSVELQEIMDAAEKYQKVFTINHNRRTNKDFLLMREHVEKGLLGEVYAIESRVHGSRGLTKGWRTLKRLGGGMMLDWGVHMIDQILHMQDEKVVNVFCKMYSIHYPEIDDSFKLTLTLESGKTVLIDIATNNFIALPRWYVLGKQGTLQIDDWNCNGRIVRCVDKENVWSEEIVYTKAGPTKTMAPRSEKSTETIEIFDDSDEEWSVEFAKSIQVVYDQFLDAVEGKAALTITAEQAMRVMKVIEAAFLSHETKAAVEVNI